MNETECVTFGLEDKKFFILERSGKTPEISVHRAIDSAVARIRALLKTNIDSKELALTRITVGDDAFTAQPIDWAEIAAKLIATEE